MIFYIFFVSVVFCFDHCIDIIVQKVIIRKFFCNILVILFQQ